MSMGRHTLKPKSLGLGAVTTDLNQILVSVDKHLAESRAKCELLRNDVSTRETKLAELRDNQEIFRKAHILISAAADEARESVRQKFEKTVTAALQIVFGDNYSFGIHVVQHKNTTQTEFYISSPENREPQDPMENRGGSVVDVIAIALRIAYLAEIGMPGPVFLDEPTKHVAEYRRESTAEMLSTLQQITNRQIIAVSHDNTLIERFPGGLRLG